MIEIIIITKCGLYKSTSDFHNSSKITERITTDYEIEYYLTDNGLSFIDDNIYPHEKGNLLFIRPHQRRHNVNSFSCQRLCFKLEPQLEHYFENVPNVINTISRPLYKHYLDDIAYLYNAPKADNTLLLQSNLFKLLHQIYADSQFEIQKNKKHMKIDSRVITKAVDYIENNYAKPISLSDIAASVNLNYVYFHKIFSLYIGKTPHDFLFDKRIIVAKHLLITTKLPLSQIAEKCGFSSQAYFSTVFQKECGLTPSKYRNYK